MSGPKRDADSFNTIGIVAIGICGVVMVYVTIVFLQAFYMNDTAEIQTMADYGGQDTVARSRRADEIRNITEAGANVVAPGTPQTYRIRIDGDDGAMQLIVRDAQKSPDHLVPLLKPAVKVTVQPVPPGGEAIDPASQVDPRSAGSADDTGQSSPKDGIGQRNTADAPPAPPAPSARPATEGHAR